MCLSNLTTIGNLNGGCGGARLKFLSHYMVFKYIRIYTYILFSMFEIDQYVDTINDERNASNVEEEATLDEHPETVDVTSGDKVEVKIRRKRNLIRPIDRFMGDRGLEAVGEYYKEIRFKGKHREAEDVNAIMDGLQHWAHRAFPKMKFDDALTIIEGLTKKRVVQTHMTKYRLDMLQPPVQTARLEGDEQGGEDEIGSEPLDEFDDLLGDQIEQMTRVQRQKTNALNNTSIFSLNQSVDASLGCSAIPQTPEPVVAKKTSLTSEQTTQIAKNRLRALERLKQKQAEAGKGVSVVYDD